MYTVKPMNTARVSVLSQTRPIHIGQKQYNSLICLLVHLVRVNTHMGYTTVYTCVNEE